MTRRAVEAAYMSAAEGDEWLRYLSTERFFASVSLFVTLAEKPGSWGGPDLGRSAHSARTALIAACECACARLIGPEIQVRGALRCDSL